MEQETEEEEEHFKETYNLQQRNKSAGQLTNHVVVSLSSSYFGQIRSTTVAWLIQKYFFSVDISKCWQQSQRVARLHGRKVSTGPEPYNFEAKISST